MAARSDEDKTGAAEATEQRAAKKSLTLLIGFCAGVLFLAVAAGVAARMMLGGGKQSTEQVKSELEMQIPDVKDASYAYVDLESVTVNANVPRRDRYIRATITLAVPSSVAGKVTDRINAKKPELRNWLTVYLSGLTVEQAGGENLNRLREEIRDCINRQLWPDQKSVIQQVLFKEFAVQ